MISPEGSGLFSFCHAGGNNDASKFITIHMYLMFVFIIRAIMCKVRTYTYILYVYLQMHIYTYVEAYSTWLPILCIQRCIQICIYIYILYVYKSICNHQNSSHYAVSKVAKLRLTGCRCTKSWSLEFQCFSESWCRPSSLRLPLKLLIKVKWVEVYWNDILLWEVQEHPLLAIVSKHFKAYFIIWCQ